MSEQDKIENCRYGDCALALLEGHEILAFAGEAEYQGSAAVIARLEKGNAELYVLLQWDWGSCSGCDDWEQRDLSNEEIVEEMRNSLALFESREQLDAFLQNCTYEYNALKEAWKEANENQATN